MKNTVLSSCADIVGRLSIPKEGQTGKPKTIVKNEELSYRPFEEEIVQELQFTYTPPREKKTRKMIAETDSTGQ